MIIKREDGSVAVRGYGFFVGKVPYKIPYWLIPRRIREALELVATTEGLVGIAPFKDKSLIVYETLNDAKRARNILLANGIKVYGTEIEEVDTTAGGTVTRYV